MIPGRGRRHCLRYPWQPGTPFEKREGSYNDHCTVVVVIGLPFFYMGPQKNSKRTNAETLRTQETYSESREQGPC